MNSPLRVPLSAPHPAHEATPQAAAAPPVPLLAVLVASIIVLGSIAMVLARIQAASTPISTGTCPSVATLHQALTVQEQAGQWSAAAGTADLALTTPNLCAADRHTLLTRSVQNKLEALLSTSISLDNVAYLRNEVGRYDALAQRAQAEGLVFPTPREIARRAYALGKDLLAQHAYDIAFQQGMVPTSDREDVEQYATAVYELGYVWATQTTGYSHTDGLRLLATSWHLDTCFHLGDTAPLQALTVALGTQEYRWPQPAPSPLLVGCPANRGHTPHGVAVRKETVHE